MKWTTSARWLVAAGLCTTALFTACSDGDVVTAPGGSGGSDASAGNGSDDGGTSSAGTKAEPGGAGESMGGSSPGSAGDGPVSSGGDSSAGGGNVPTVAMCQEACADDKDCLDGFECQESRCVSTAEPPEKCSSDDLCRAQLSGWTTECNEQSDCLLTQVCVDIGEEMGRCATAAGGIVSCETLQQDEIETKDFAGEDATVCGRSRAECGDSGACFERCDKDSCGENFACNETSGACECDNDKACEGLPNVSQCVAGQCVCADDGDCTVNANKCNSGVCGCGDASVCDQDAAHPGTSWVCE